MFYKQSFVTDYFLLTSVLWPSVNIFQYLSLSLYGCSEVYVTSSLLLNVCYFPFLSVVNNDSVNMWVGASLSDYFLRIMF